MILKIVKYGEPILEKVAAPVTDFDTKELHQLVDDMFETMYAAKGVGLAAPQVGVNRRISVIDISVGEDPEQKIAIINPEVLFKEGKQVGEEGCLSIPGFREPVTRANKVTIRAQTVTGDVVEWNGEELLARAFLHEIDHLDGILFLNHLSTLKRDIIRRKIKKLQKAASGISRPMRIVFMGTPEFAVPSLQALARSGHEILAAVTQPDRPKGRGNQVAASPVKLAAIELGIEVRQPERIRRPESMEWLRSLSPELMVVVGYGQIIPQSIIDIPPHGILNVHGSLLPKYRGAAPIQWAIANGEHETGVTIMQIDAGLDTGDMLSKRTLAIGPDETAPELSARMAVDGANLLVETLRAIEGGTIKREKQKSHRCHACPYPEKEDGAVDWHRNAVETYNRFRGFNPWPGAYTTFRGQTLVLTSMRPVSSLRLAPATLQADKRRLLAGCGEGTALELLEVQPAGKKRMTIDAFLNGYQPKNIGEIQLNLPQGFRYAATYAGIRKQERDDVALIVADRPAQAAAVFTRNLVQAAPVQLSKRHLKKSGGKVSAILVNAGNANCATRTGLPVASASTKAVAAALKTKPEYVPPASTGVIGVEMDPAPLLAAVPKLIAELSPDSFYQVANAIMTTDTRVKIANEELNFKSGMVRIAGTTKGSGMIHPNMATTLGFVMTDAVIPAASLRQILKSSIATSFNSLSVDGDMSTNDMVALLASGASNVKPTGKDLLSVTAAIARVLESLAEQIAADGEGARKLIVIETLGFKTSDEARQAARAIANSPLVKTAIAGSDPNWGRILSAAGYSGIAFDPRKVEIYLQDVLVCRNGLAVDMDESAMKRRLDGHQVDIKFEVKRGGKGRARFFTCDLTEGYIQINGSYRT